MKPRKNLGNIAIVAVAVVAFGAFVFLATKGGNHHSNLSAVAPTTTIKRVTTTTEEPTTTTTLFVEDSTTTAPAPVTVATTTATTVKHTTTTKKPTTSTTAASPSGPVTEHTDNSASFTHGSDGSFSASATQPPSGADPFRFTIKTAAGGGVSGDTASVKFTVTMDNQSGKSVAFPDNNIVVTVTLHTSGGSDIVFTMTASNQAPLKSGEAITLSQTRDVSGYGTFDATATCDVNYG
ncbi:MAG TPA: hypothetical protein VHD87_16495 [Acidimicrobiales bacterium]|nr:hypothetical protein [Acidimicrobiales bacterium]